MSWPCTFCQPTTVKTWDLSRGNQQDEQVEAGGFHILKMFFKKTNKQLMERTWTWPMINSIQNNVICLTYGWFTPFWSKSEIIVSITPRRKDRFLYKVFHRCKDWKRGFSSPQSAWESKEFNYNAQWLQIRSPDAWGSSHCHRKQKEGRCVTSEDGGDTSNERTMPKFKVVWTQQDFCKAASYWMR